MYHIFYVLYISKLYINVVKVFNSSAIYSTPTLHSISIETTIFSSFHWFLLLFTAISLNKLSWILISLFIIFLVGRVFWFTPDPAFTPQPTVTLLFILPYLLSYVSSLPFPSQYIVYYLFVVVGIVC